MESSDGGAKSCGVNRRITDELRFDQLKKFAQPVQVNQTLPQEGPVQNIFLTQFRLRPL
jgi:hypothetical protein